MELVVLIIDINRISHIVAAPPPLFHITVEWLLSSNQRREIYCL